MASATEQDEREQKDQNPSFTNSQNYYDLLGISPQATDEEIKRAYRQKALRLHPDKNPDPQAATQFQAVDKAYKILSDPKLRSAYDQFGPRTADTMRKMNDEYSEAMARMPRWKKILFTFLCLGTCCCFGGGCCCLCGCLCCCNFCCNHCCGKYKPEEDPFSSFQEEEEIPGLRTQKHVHQTKPTEIDPVLRSNSGENSAPIAANYEATAETKNH